MTRTLAAPLAALLLAALTACSTGSTASTSAAAPTPAATGDPDAFPVTLAHAFGETTIEHAPTRVATLGWSDDDMALSLGVVPVGATARTWGGNDQQSTDWFDEALAAAGSEQPVRYDDTDGTPVEEVAALAPDLILATNSGITQKDYEKLSRIAPVVAYPEHPWVTDWRTSLDLVGAALGLADEADAVEARTTAVIEDAKAAYPQLQGTSFVFAYLTPADLSTIGIYGAEDNRVRTMTELGMTSAEIVDDVVEDGQFYGTLSAERAAEVDADVLLTYAEAEGDLTALRKDRLLGRIPALAGGHAHAEVDRHVGLSITNPSPLSMPYIVEHYLPAVAEVVPSS